MREVARGRLTGVVRQPRQIAAAAFDVHEVLPVSPNFPGRVSRIPGVRFVHDQIIEDRPFRVVVTARLDVILDGPLVHVWGISKIGPVVHDVLKSRERGLIEIGAGSDVLEDSPVAEVPPILSGGIVLVNRVVVPDHVDSGIGDAVAILISALIGLVARNGGASGEQWCERAR